MQEPKLFRIIIYQGENAQCKFLKGLMHVEGIDFGQDLAKGKSELEWAAKKELPEACRELGGRLCTGRKFSKDPAEGVKWLEVAAKKGDAVAQYRLFKQYRKGEGVAKDMATALIWLRASAKKGYLHACCQLDHLFPSKSEDQIDLIAKEFKVLKT